MANKDKYCNEGVMSLSLSGVTDMYIFIYILYFIFYIISDLTFLSCHVVMTESHLRYSHGMSWCRAGQDWTGTFLNSFTFSIEEILLRPVYYKEARVYILVEHLYFPSLSVFQDPYFLLLSVV